MTASALHRLDGARPDEARIRALLGHIGTRRYLAYRKRFDEPGIARELRRAEPHLSAAQAESIVAAGRWIRRQGLDLAALALVRTGKVEDMSSDGRLPPLGDSGRSWLVTLGGVVAVLYLALAVIASTTG